MFDSLFIHRYDIVVSPSADVHFTGWIGAVLRNNFMFSAENTPIGNQTLMEIINSSTLPEAHPLYKPMKDN